MLPWIVRNGLAAARTKRIARHGVRNAFQYTGLVAWFYAVTMISLADLSALQFTMPLFTIVMAALFLSERIGVHRWIATAIGFVGALVILRPGFAEIGPGALFALTAAFLYSASFTVTKQLSGTESANVVVFYMSVFIVVFSAIPAAFVWKTPDWSDAAPIVALGVTGYITHYCVTRSMAAADASYVVPFDFLRLPFSAILGALLFAEASPIWTWVGAVVIFGAAYYNTRQEKRLGGRPFR
jgi:drug/metabolite transporter (DMT)-like permease